MEVTCAYVTMVRTQLACHFFSFVLSSFVTLCVWVLGVAPRDFLLIDE